VAPALILAFLCLACAPHGRTQGGHVNSDSNLSNRCAVSLASLARSSGATPSLEGNRIRINKDELQLSANIEDEGQAQSQYAVGLAVGVSVNGVARPLTVGSVGIGASREEAVETAVSEWAQLAGVALLDALGVRKQGGLTFGAGRFSVHPGLMGIRGSQDVVWSDDSQRRLLDSLGALIRGLESSPSEFHSVSIRLVVEPGGVSGGECRVDGAVSAEALKAVHSFPWPPTTKGYMFKQFYVLRRRS
jgi:hypothetical protein